MYMTYFFWDRAGRIGPPRQHGLWDADIYSYGGYLNIPARMEDHSLGEAVKRCEPTQGANPGTDSGHAYL